MDYPKRLVVPALIVIVVLLGYLLWHRPLAQQPVPAPVGAGSNDTTNLNLVAVQESYDGYMIGGTAIPSATGTVTTLYTHTGKTALCNATQGGLYADATAAIAASLQLSVGTSTSAAYANNLLASSTLATSTDSFAKPAASLFVLSYGDKITAMFGDGVTNASSTYIGNWKIYFQAECWTL